MQCQAEAQGLLGRQHDRRAADVEPLVRRRERRRCLQDDIDDAGFRRAGACQQRLGVRHRLDALQEGRPRLRIGIAAAQRLADDRRDNGERVLDAMFQLSVEQARLTPGFDRGRRLDHRVDHPADHAGLVADRAVAEREMGFLGIAVPVDDEREVLDERRLAGEGALGDRPDLVPNLAPHLAERPAERRRLSAENGQERFVADGDEVGSPEDAFGEFRIHHHADGDLEGGRPLFERPEGGRGPVVGPDDVGHFSAAIEEMNGLAQFDTPSRRLRR